MAKRTADQRRIIERNKRRKERAAEQDLKLPKVVNPARKSKCEKDVFLWLKTYLPDYFTNEFTDDQRLIVTEILYRASHGGSKAIAAPRADGKTTIAEAVILFCLLTGKLKFPVIVGANGDAAEDILTRIKQQIERNDMLFADYPEVCFPVRELRGSPQRAGSQTVGGRRTFLKWGADAIVLPTTSRSRSSGSALTTRGLDAAIRGLRVGNRRPDFLLIDDPETRESVKSGEMTRTRRLIIEQDLGGLGSGSDKLGQVMLTTIMRRTTADGEPTISFEYTDCKMRPSWDGLRLRQLKTPPNRIDLWEEYVRLRQGDFQNRDKLARRAFEFYASQRVEMDAGAVVSNPNKYQWKLADDGLPIELSAIQSYYNLIADRGEEHVRTEYQNDPVEEDNQVQRLILTAHHIQHNCSSGLERRIVPDGAVLLTRGADLQKRGLHWVVIAWDSESAGCVIDYDFFSFGTDGQSAADCELAILEGLWAWREATNEHPYHFASGAESPIDLTLIDMGWKDETWSSQPVQVFCGALGNSEFMPSKGQSPYRIPKPDKNTIIGDNWHCAFPNPFVAMNTDHWKLKVHEGFLCERGAAGSLSLFAHPIRDGRADRNFHLSYSKHILAESWETRLKPGFKRPETKWWHFGKPNHYLDATYQAIAARSVRGLNILSQVGIPADVQPPSPPPSRQQSQTMERNPARPETGSRRRINFRRRGA